MRAVTSARASARIKESDEHREIVIFWSKKKAPERLVGGAPAWEAFHPGFTRRTDQNGGRTVGGHPRPGRH